MRYGVIGTGTMGIEHIESLDAIDRAEVVAVADPDEGSREAAGKVCGPEVSVHEDHRTLLDEGRCDVVVVASPNHTHVDVLGDVLTHPGSEHVHVLIEKPLCTTIDDCRQVQAAAEGRTGLVHVGLEYRYMPPVTRLVEEVQAGAVGTVRMLGIREHRFPFLDKVGDWNRFKVNTGDTLVEKCCHFFDLMRLIVGDRPVRVMASGGQDVNHLDERYEGQTPDILDNAFVIVDFEHGARASLDLCMFAEATHNQEELSVVGDNGKVEALIPEGVLRLGRRGEHWIGQVDVEQVDIDHVAVMANHHGSTYLQHLALLEAIDAGGPPPVTLEDGLWSVAMGLAGHRSIDEGRPVTLDEVLGS